MSDNGTSNAPFDADTLLSQARFDAAGLLVAVAQEHLTGELRMVAYMNREALERTLATGEAHFWSRSRGALWKKGESSGNTLRVREVLLDCDGDALLLRVEPQGPTCHTGEDSCFFRSVGSAPPSRPLAFLERLEQVLAARATAGGERSYTRKLLEAGAELVGRKLREEADELARATDHEDRGRVVSEAADLLYHSLVALRLRGVAWREVLAELERRFGVSGLEEKASRQPKS